MMKYIIRGVLLIIVSFTGHAKPIGKVGWEASLNVNLGYVQSQSHMSVSDNNALISNFSAPTRTTQKVIAYPLATLRYTFPNQKHQLYIGNSNEQISNARFQYELGYVHQTQQRGKITFAYSPQLPWLNEAWSDPYALNVQRNKTDMDTQGGRIAWHQFLGLPFSLKYAYAKIDIGDEQSGVQFGLPLEQRNTLDRNGWAHQAGIETFFPIHKSWFIRPAFLTTWQNRQGKVSASDEYKAKISLLNFQAPHTVIASVEVGSREGRAIHPIFNKTLKEERYSAFIIYDYAGIFGFERISLNLIGGYFNTQANIAFFEQQGLIAGAGLTYRF